MSAVLTANMVIEGNVSEYVQNFLYETFIRMYGEFVDICNGGLISLLNAEWNDNPKHKEPSSSNEEMLEYNRFMAKYFQIAANTVNKMSYPRTAMALFIVSDTAECRGKWHDVVVRIDWNSIKH